MSVGAQRSERFGDHFEPIACKVGRLLSTYGFDLATSEGEPLMTITPKKVFGLLYRPPRQDLYSRATPPRVFLGALHLDNPGRGTNNKTWVLEVHAFQHIDIIQTLAYRLARKFEKEIKIEFLGREQAEKIVRPLSAVV